MSWVHISLVHLFWCSFIVCFSFFLLSFFHLLPCACVHFVSFCTCMFWLFICLFILTFVISLFPFFVHSFRGSMVLLLYHCVHSLVFSFLHSSVLVFLVFLILWVLNSGLLGQYSSVSTIRGPIEAHYSITLLFLRQKGAKKKIFQRSLGSPPSDY